MSWIEDIKNDFIIQLGDGTEFRPLWLNAVKTKGYNIAEFEFPNINGTLVTRTTSKGARYSLEIYFQGDDHLEVSRSFEAAAEDSRSWTIAHPFYGSIIVQPSELTFDNTKFNVTKITGTVIETIVNSNPRTTIRPSDNIALLKEQNDAASIATFNDTPNRSDASWLLNQLNRYYKSGKALKSTQEQSQEYFNSFNTATASINKIATEPQRAMSSVQAVINAPALFSSNVIQKASGLSDQFASLKASISGITSRANKKMFAINGSSILSAQALAVISPTEELNLTRSEVLTLAESLMDNYNEFIESLDDLQTDNNGEVDSFIPEFDSMLGLNQIISTAVTALFELSTNSRQTRSIILEDDSDLINLVHRFYGSDNFEENIDLFIRSNNIGLNHMLEIRKGSTIIYYV